MDILGKQNKDSCLGKHKDIKYMVCSGGSDHDCSKRNGGKWEYNETD